MKSATCTRLKNNISLAQSKSANDDDDDGEKENINISPAGRTRRKRQLNHRSSPSTSTCHPRRRRRRKIQAYQITFILATLISLSTFSSLMQPCIAENEDIDDYFNQDYDDQQQQQQQQQEEEEEGREEDYFTSSPTPAPTTPAPTVAPTSRPTYPPTHYPTDSPTPNPTAEPTRAGDDFYEVQIDDYTVETQTAKIYMSSISDVMLCLLCTFFWVLWLVGTIFPTKIQHLYKSEGVVVVGQIIESYVTHGEAGSPGENEVQEGESQSEIYGAGGDTFDDLKNLPTYHAIVSYIVPGKIARGRRRRGVRSTGGGSPKNHNATVSAKSPTNKYHLHEDKGGTGTSAMATHPMEELAQKLSVDHVKVGMRTPPRPPQRVGSRLNKTIPSKDQRNKMLSKISEECGKSKASNNIDTHTSSNQKSLFDSCTKSFETEKSPLSDKSPPSDKSSPTDKNICRKDIIGCYKYNRTDKSDYDLREDDWEDEYENPELIGSLFHSFGLSGFGTNQKKTVDEDPPPVRVKKRFETNELYKPGYGNVEIIVLPGNPGSGILKNEFELEEDYMLNGTVSGEDYHEGDDAPTNNVESAAQMGDLTAGAIGAVLAAVSVIGAVHGALTLPYQTRAFGWMLVIFSLSIMWPTAMLTYKLVNKLRLFMMNKIISFEPCGDNTNLYGLSRLPRAKLATCSDNSGKGSGENGGGEYVIMLDSTDAGVGSQGIWSQQDEDSALSSLSGGHQIV